MSPTSKNALKIGAALIIIALLLVCGPLSDRFGGSQKVDETPPVAAGPPVDESDELDAMVAGALVGSSADEIDPVAEDELDGIGGGIAESSDADVPVALAAAGVGAAAVGAGLAASESGGGGGGNAGGPGDDGGIGGPSAPAILPPVSAGPEADVAAPIVLAAAPIVDPARVFDSSEGVGGPGGGPPNERFAVPVAAAGDGNQTRQPFGIADNTSFRPCESGGSGCGGPGRSFIAAGGITPFGSGNPRGGGTP